MGKRHAQSIYDELSIKYLIEKKSLTELSKLSGIDRRTLSENFKRMGIEIINRQNMSKFNENIFDEIDTEEKAYWLGFIYADGYISSDPLDNYKKPRYSFELSLKEDDKNHLNKFNKFMEHEKNNVKIGKVKNSSEEVFLRCRWSIVNKHLWNTLNNYGCTPRKSLTLEFPDENIFKSKDLIRHFIRGYFDGDGCITYQVDKNEKVHGICSIIGTPLFLDKLEENLKFSSKITRCKDKRITENTVSLSFKRSESIDLINYLYKDSSVYLYRKYILYTFFNKGCRFLKEFKKLLLTNFGKTL